jgi:ABC-type multidrug transport system permease subunit
LSAPAPQYWINHQAQKGAVVEQLLTRQGSDKQWLAQQVSGAELRYIDWAIPGILSMNLMFSGLFGVGYVIVRYRKNGVLKRLQATPVSPLAFLGAQVLSRLIIMLAVSIMVYMAANLFLDFVMLGSYLNLLWVALLGNVCLLSLGLIVASRIASEEAANGLLNVMTFPMLLLSEVWFSLDGAPPWMVAISQCLPLTHMVQAARLIMLDGEGLAAIAPHLLTLGAMTALFLALSVWLFKWRAD